jgi:glycerate dehydrogenase
MKLVITDGDTLNPGDLDWTPLSALGEVVYYGSTPKELAAERCADADIIISNKTIISRAVIETASHLKMIAVSATGYNNIDIQATKEAGVIVSNVPEYGTFSVAQHTFALLLELVNHVGLNAASTRNDGWAKAAVWSYTKRPIMELKGKILGIVGFGRIGKQVAVLGKAFGMEIIFNNRSLIDHPGARQVDLQEIFRTSDVVSLHCPLTNENKHFVNSKNLSSMKRSAFLINTSRGPLINEDELLTALEKEMLAGAALDVLSEEPPRPGRALLDHPRCIVTPHNAWISFEARAKLMEETIRNIHGFLKNKPLNIVG